MFERLGGFLNKKVSPENSAGKGELGDENLVTTDIVFSQIDGSVEIMTIQREDKSVGIEQKTE